MGTREKFGTRAAHAELMAEAKKQKVSLLRRDLFYKTGVKVWEATYAAKSNDDPGAWSFVVANLMQNVGLGGHMVNGDFAVEETRTPLCLMSCARWVDGGCRILTTDERYFAAMAHTKIGIDAVEDLKVPWPAFMVEWPAGLCVAEDGYDYNCALFAQFKGMPRADEKVEDVAFMMLGNQSGPASPDITRWVVGNLATLLFANDLPDGPMFREVDEERTDGDRAIQEMACRATAGLLYTLQHTTNWKTSAFASPVQRGQLRSSPPPHRVIMIGRPLQVDATSSVRERAAGRHGAPAVQTLVRGHVKRQVVGYGRTGRKVIWVEPYWRGPEDAPILARPYKVGPSAPPPATPRSSPSGGAHG